MYSEDRQKDLETLDKSVKKIERQAQTNMNSRLDKMRFKNYTAVEFANTAPHPSTDISFVTNLDNTISLYKGDTEISGSGTEIESDIVYAAYCSYSSGVDGRIDPVGVSNRDSFEDVPIMSTGGGRNLYGYHAQNSAADIQGTFCYFSTKAFLDSRLSDDNLEDGFSNWGITGFSAPCASISRAFPFYRDNGNGDYQLEVLSINASIDSIVGVPNTSGITRTYTSDGWLNTGSYTFSTYNLLYKLSINRSGQYVGQAQTTEVTGLPGQWTITNASTPSMKYVPCGFIFGAGKIEDIGVTPSQQASFSDLKMVKDLAILWLPGISYGTFPNGSAGSDNKWYYPTATYIKESSSRPLGIKYDINTGARLNDPIFCVTSSNDQMWAYSMALPKSINIEEE